MKKQLNIVSREEADKLFAEEAKADREYIEYNGCDDVDGLFYYFYIDRRNGKEFAVRQTRTVHMGFNDTDPTQVLRFRKIVEREGDCYASWGVTGRTAHEMLGYKLAASLPQYDWEIGGNYICKATKR